VLLLEAYSVSRLVNTSPVREEVQKLHARIEGWIAGLHLAALTLHDHPDKGDMVAAFTGSHRHLIEYLVQEVMARQSEEVSTFLLYSALMEKFNVSLINALMPGTNGTEMLDYLESANLFLNSLDDQRDWYRYHALFADFLRQRLRNEQPEMVPKLFMRASQWYETQGMVDKAIEYAFLGDDLMQAARLLDRIAETLILINAEVNMLISWADRLPLEVRALFPRLCIFQATALQFEYKLEAAESLLTLAEENLPDPAKLPNNLNLSYLTNLVKVTRTTSMGPHIAFGIPPATAGLLLIPLIMTVLTVAMIVFTVVVWVGGEWSLAWRAYYTVLTVASVAFIWFLNSWNLLGWRF
jgi:LuxR family maltose regulon positive regulatory protein